MSIPHVLDNLFRDHQSSVKTFSDITDTEITTDSSIKYVFNNANRITINMNTGCKQLTLDHCKNVNIIAVRLPIMGINIVRADNIKVDIARSPPKSGSGFMNLDHSVLCDLESDQDCMVEVNQCTGIMLNGINISDKYVDSTWRMD